MDSQSIQAYLSGEFVNQNTNMQPTPGEMIVLYTNAGPCGPLECQATPFYVTLLAQAPITIPLKQPLDKCVSSLKATLSRIQHDVAAKANRSLDFVNTHIIDVRFKNCNTFIMVSIDVCVSCVYQPIGMLDWFDI